MVKSGKFSRTGPLLRSGCALRLVLMVQGLEGLQAHLQTWRLKRRVREQTLSRYGTEVLHGTRATEGTELRYHESTNVRVFSFRVSGLEPIQQRELLYWMP
eukprot:4214849-Alexandrium_andersonii.AAC.1